VEAINQFAFFFFAAGSGGGAHDGQQSPRLLFPGLNSKAHKT
jgi:hypothetical protein